MSDATTDGTAPPRVLAIHAHPDDLELQCAGTLVRLKKRGCEIVMMTLTPGDKGSAILPADEIAAVRRGEAAAAAAQIGAEYHCLEFRDLEIEFSVESRRRITEAVRRAAPQIILTAPPVDYMADHEVTSQLVRDACFAATLPNYRTHSWDSAPILSRLPHLYYCDPLDGTDAFGRPLDPQFVVDISDSIDEKLAMLACHASQREWLRKQHGIDEYLDACRRFAARRGKQVGVLYGEGYRQHLGHPFPQGNRLLELLGGSMMESAASQPPPHTAR